MITKGITIQWDASIEYIEIDLDDLTEITSTLELWKGKEFFRYNTLSSLEHFNDGTSKLMLEYKHENNTHMNYEDAMWGVSTLTFTPEKSEGTVEWRGFDTSKGDGIVTWKSFAVDLISQKRKKTVSQLDRKQQLFRNALFTFEPHCAITGESTKSALEAAHIIPAKDGGGEVVANGILLRADIHRLYDAGVFSIDLAGNIVNIKDNISPEYFKLLDNTRIPNKTLVRIKKALKYQSDRMMNKYSTLRLSNR